MEATHPDLMVVISKAAALQLSLVIASLIALCLMRKLEPRHGRGLALTGTGLMLGSASLTLAWTIVQWPLVAWMAERVAVPGYVYSLLTLAFILMFSIGVIQFVYGACEMIRATEIGQPGAGHE